MPPAGDEMVTAGTGLGVANWALVNSTRVLVFSLATHKSPDGSKTTTMGPYMPWVKLASGATSPLELGGYTSTSPLASTPVPLGCAPEDRATLGDDDAPRCEGANAKRSGRGFGRCNQDGYSDRLRRLGRSAQRRRSRRPDWCGLHELWARRRAPRLGDKARA